jgi:NAD+ diphosphatase
MTLHSMTISLTGSPVPYSWRWLDRATVRRADPGWLAGIRAAPQARVIPIWQDHCVVHSAPSRAVVLAGERGQELLGGAADVVFLGLDGDAGVFAVDLSDLTEAAAVSLAGGAATADVRRVFTEHTAADAAMLAYARGLLHWTRNQRYCGRCGAATEPRDGGHVRACLDSACGRLLFPRIEPAVIVLVESAAGRCLLARHRNSVLGAFSTLAGFVEIGESLEDAVCREVTEEAGVTLREVSYLGSQPWPFPSGLMVAFRATAATEAIEIDHNELVEARWFTREELVEQAAAGRLGRVDSIDRVLLRSWLDEAG